MKMLRTKNKSCGSLAAQNITLQDRKKTAKDVKCTNTYQITPVTKNGFSSTLAGGRRKYLSRFKFLFKSIILS